MPFHAAGISESSSPTLAPGQSVGTIVSTSGCSGASTMYVAPKSVSGRVVNTVTTSSLPSSSKSTDAPVDRPIQFRCISLIDSLQSSRSRSASRRSAYAVMRSIHCFSGRRYTGWLPRSLRPSAVTSSLASTVPSAGHQLTGASCRYASRYESTSSRRPRASSSAQPYSGSASRTGISSAMGRARSASSSYQLSKICRKIHCVQR